MRLLLAEDDPRLLKSLTHIFEANRFVTDGVSNGEDAWTGSKSSNGCAGRASYRLSCF